MLFHRDFTEYTGGHGKVWDYFRHALALGWDARIHLAPRSVRDDSNPWMRVADRIDTEWQPASTDVLFLAGLDWQAGVPDSVPVINLVQHVRHADMGHPLRAFLPRAAHRICVSAAVADAIHATGEVRGPVHVIPAALDVPAMTAIDKMPGRIVIGAIKNPALGVEIARILDRKGVQHELLDAWQPRPDFLHALAGAQIAILLPHPTEGFYLPGLEAMALGAAVVMPDCIGNSAYARAGENCLMPAADAQILADAALALLDASLREPLLRAARAEAQRHTQTRERDAFAAVLATLS